MQSVLRLIRREAVGAAAVFAAALLCFLPALPRLFRKTAMQFFATEATL